MRMDSLIETLLNSNELPVRFRNLVRVLGRKTTMEYE
jgi:hypothetical protein